MIGLELSGVASVLVVAASLLAAAHVLHTVTGRADPLSGLLRFTALVLIAVGLLGACLIATSGLGFFAWLVVMGVWARAAYHYRAAQKRNLFAALSLAVTRQMPLAPMALAFADEQEGAFANLARAVARRLEAGYSLPEVISVSRAALPPQAMLAACLGEASGDLTGSLAASTNTSLFDRGLLRPVMLRLIYVLPVMLLFLGFMQLKIGPSMAKIFDDFDTELPPITRIVLGSAPLMLPQGGWGWGNESSFGLLLAWLGMVFLNNLGWLLMLATFFVALVAWLEWRGTWRPRLPWWKKIVNWLDMAVVLRVLGLAAERGRPLPQVLDLLADDFPKQQLRRTMRRVAVEVDQGVPWQRSLRDEGLLSAADAAVLGAAQRAGNLPWAMREMADSLERRANYRLQALAQVAMPMVLIPAGLLVGILVVAYFIPLTTLIWSLSVLTHARRGIVILETVVASALLVALVAVSLQMLSMAAAQRRAVDERAIALAEAANLAERISTLPFDEITTDGLAEIQLSAAAKRSLSQGELKLDVEPLNSPPQGKRVSIEITWKGSPRVESPVRLTFWTYATSRGSTP